eukprot:scaffold36159_cov36-Phaeocystis_antarctica.AAC.1
MTCAQTIVSASHCVGLTLPGMIDEPGSFSGSEISPRPERGLGVRGKCLGVGLGLGLGLELGLGLGVRVRVGVQVRVGVTPSRGSG